MIAKVTTLCYYRVMSHHLMAMKVPGKTKHPLGPPRQLVEAVTQYCLTENRDLWLYSGHIMEPYADQFIDALTAKDDKRKEVTIFLTTFGGDPHRAYKIARCMHRNYAHVKLLITGPCKSAGTLIALGADEIAFGIHGELGPLDMQVPKPGELADIASALDTMKAFDSIKTRVFSSFMDYMLDFTTVTGNAISTSAICEVASKLAIGLISPIAAQIDPYRLGEVSRSMAIGTEYAGRLTADERSNVQKDKIQKLVEEYPAHGFVIDEQEAAEIFDSVGKMTDDEREIYKHVDAFLRKPKHPATILDLGALAAKKDDVADELKEENDNGNGSGGGPQGDEVTPETVHKSVV